MNGRAASKGRLRKARKLVRLARVPLYRSAGRLGAAATVEHDGVPFGDGFRTVIDVGAHHGQFATFAARRFPDARIVCVEPYGPARERLHRLRGLLPQITVAPYAAGAAPGIAPLHISRESDSSSLLPILESYTEAFPGTEEVGEDMVDVRPLDEIVGDVVLPVLLKIDVQGTELAVLRGAPRVLAACRGVFVECSFVEFYEGQPLAAEVIAFLADRFILEGVYGLVRDRRGRCLQADLLFRARSTG